MLCCEYQDHILCLNETWLDSSYSDALFAQSHVAFRVDRIGRSGGGTMILVPKVFHCFTPHAAIITDDYECVVVDVGLGVGSKFRIVCAYRTPSARCAAGLVTYLETAFDAELPIIAAGDFNLPNIDWSNLTLQPRAAPAERQLFSCLVSHGFEQLVTTPTRRENILDLVFTSRPGMISSLSVCAPILPSDHYMVVFDIRVPARAPLAAKRKFRNFRKGDYSRLHSAS